MSLLALAEARFSWLYEITGLVLAALLVLNVLVFLVVYARRIRQSVRGKRERRVRARLDALLPLLDEPTLRDPGRLRAEVAGFNELERPIAAMMLIEHISQESPEARANLAPILREIGAVDLMVSSTRGRMPWRRALAVRTLGWVGDKQTLPVVIDRLDDPSRGVRDSAVRALGRMGDLDARPLLADLFRAPGRVSSGLVYDALVSLGPAAATVFTESLHSEIEEVRVAACFGVAALSQPEDARAAIEPLLADPSGRVRAAACESLGFIGGEALPDGLEAAIRDAEPTVRAAAAEALGAFDDDRAVQVAAAALEDPDRDAVLSAAASLVRLSSGRLAGPSATAALGRSARAWPVEHALARAALETG
jgi:HEAT repeat-containing taxis protein